MKKFKKSDFKKLSWSEYQRSACKIAREIDDFCKANELKIDFIVPILRGGGPLAISLSHMLSIDRIYPSQYKYCKDYERKEYSPVELLSTIETIEDKSKEYIVLVTEGNHVRGTTAGLCIAKIRRVLPNCKIVYASVGRDMMHLAPLDGTIFEAYGFKTNETNQHYGIELEDKDIKDKFVVYPWETVEEELREVNNHESFNSGGN